MSKFLKAMNNVTYTENKAITNKSSNNPLVDFFFHGAALRNETNEDRILNLFKDAFVEDKTTALRILFYIRDIRGGQGERRVFRIILKWLANTYSDWLKENMSLIPEYGRWDDLFSLMNTPCQFDMVKFIGNQLIEDIGQYYRKDSVSLLAKWLPSENTSSKETRNLARFFIRSFLMTPKYYRKTLSDLRKYIDVTERKLSAKQVNQINYSTVPSKAGLLYRKAFYKHDEKRYQQYIDSVNKGKVKINTSTLYPYDVLSKYSPNGVFSDWNSRYIVEDATVEAMWKNLPDYVPDLCGLVVADTSSSMSGKPMLVSISLAMYIAERNKNEAWKDYFISFSAEPKFHKITGNNLIQRAKSVALGDVSNTNLQGVFDLILNRAIQNNVPQEDMPKVLIIVSDMEFDQATRSNTTTNFEIIKRKYITYHYDMPTLIFWNVDSRNNQCPVTVNDNGVVLLSGCSPSVFKYALGECKSPMDIVNNVVNSNRYNNIVYNQKLIYNEDNLKVENHYKYTSECNHDFSGNPPTGK